METDSPALDLEITSKKYDCDFEGCTLSFSRPGRLEQHKLLHQFVRKFICKEENCNKAYGSQAHLNRHIATVHREQRERKVYSCPTCSTLFVNRQNLKRHLGRSHSRTAETFSCDVCNTEFKKKHQLTVHMYQHTGVKSFNCELCPQSFITPYDRRRHMRFHKTYTCDMCFEEFNLWSLFQKHRKSNHLTGEYICDHCKRTFKKRTHIVRHMKTHYEIKVQTYSCHFYNCTREYIRKSSLIHHIKVCHQNIRFNCTICPATLASKARLQSHIAGHSNISERAPPKTKATGRRERWDKGILKGSTALEVVGIPSDIASVGALEPRVSQPMQESVA